MNVQIDEVLNVIRVRLGLPVESRSGRHMEVWERLYLSSSQSDKGPLDEVARALGGLVEQAVRYKLQLPLTPEPSLEDRLLLESLWDTLAHWVTQDAQKRLPRVSDRMKDALTRNAAPPPPAPKSAPAPVPAAGVARPQPRPALPVPQARPPAPAAPQARSVAPPPSTAGVPLTAITATPPSLSAGASAGPAPAVPPTPNSAAASTAAPGLPPEVLSLPSEPARPVGPQWLYKPRPELEPDLAPESQVCIHSVPGGGFLLGARVRGKKHKHEGTNCDDWFEVATEDRWTCIAVSDGAGSRKFSRVGAKESSARAVQLLQRELAAIRFPNPVVPSSGGSEPAIDRLIHKDEGNGAFHNPAVESIAQALCRAAREAYRAVEAAANERRANPIYHQLLNRPLAIEDLSATLLLAVHTRLPLNGQSKDLVLACQVGDGTVGAVGMDGAVHVLGEADSGQFSGETDFLTSARQLEPGSLERRTFALLGNLRSLFVMTDGVGDDYFPPEDELARLYADLVLNGILPADPVSPYDTSVPISFAPGEGAFDVESDVLGPGGAQRVRLRSAALFAADRGLPPTQLVRHPALLRAGSVDAPLLEAASTRQERLRLWLDAYQVRGSFDDRTLVVLHCGKDR